MREGLVDRRGIMSLSIKREESKIFLYTDQNYVPLAQDTNNAQDKNFTLPSFKAKKPTPTFKPAHPSSVIIIA